MYMIKFDYNNPVPLSIDKLDIYYNYVIDTIKNNVELLCKSEINFDNVVRRLSQIEGTCDDAKSIFNDLANAHTDEKMRVRATQLSEELAEFYVTMVEINRNIYESVQKVAKNTDITENLKDDERYFLDKTMKNFKNIGFDLAPSDFKLLNDRKLELIKLESFFDKNINNNKGSMLVSIDELKGVPKNVLDQMRIIDGKYEITTDYPIINPVLEHAENENTRKKAYILNANLCPENKKILRKIIKLHHLNAEMLGYKSYGDLQYGSMMVKSSETVIDFLDSLFPKIKKKYCDELDFIQTLYPEYFVDNKIKVWNVPFILQKYKMEHLKIDEEFIRQYFSLDTVLDSLQYIWKLFFGFDISVTKTALWADEIYRIDVVDGKKLLGYIYLDLFPRKGKYGHACCSSIKKRHKDDNIAASIVLCNFTQSTDTSPSLLHMNEVKTLFHECGHAIHNILGVSSMYSQSGFNTLLDTVEMPSQMAELWLNDRDILSIISRHYKTQERLDDTIIDNMLKSSKALKGNHYLGQLVHSYTSFYYYSNPKFVKSNNFMHMLSEALLDRYDYGGIKTKKQNTFGHLVGYYGGYYCYLWSEVFAHDIFNEIKQNNGLLDKTYGEKYRRYILSKGGGKDPNLMVHNFLGRPFNNKAFLDNVM
jgi:thimet oligopeptidase